MADYVETRHPFIQSLLGKIELWSSGIEFNWSALCVHDVSDVITQDFLHRMLSFFQNWTDTHISVEVTMTCFPRVTGGCFQ